MRSDFRLSGWLRNARGAAMTEKLFVLLFAAVLVGGFVALFGPTLAAKFGVVNAALGGGSQTPTLADPVVRESSSNALMYVAFAMVAAIFFALFVTPLLFPRARRARQRVLVELAERWPFLTPLIDPDALADEGMEELRAIARDAKRFEQHKSQALEIASIDFGRQADPLDATIISDEPVRDARLDPEATMDAVARPLPTAHSHSDDEIPFGAVSPAHKPQMTPLTPRTFSSMRRWNVAT